MARSLDAKSRFGQRVRKLRRLRELTLEKLGERADLNDKYLQAIETGKQAPTIETIEKLAHGLGITVHELFAAEETSPRALRTRARELVASASDQEVEKIVRVLEALLH